MTTGPDYHRRVLACWRGKAVGGTLGQTFEGLEGPLDADFYHPVPTGMVPNDDLDLQVLYACVLADGATPAVGRHRLAQAWADHVEFPWNEYGVGMRNLAEGLQPPLTGSYDNWFTCGEGAAIRSELWACLAPGDPDLAAAYAYEDACFDHAGDGIVAAQLLARMQALAFVDTGIETILDAALAATDPASGIARVVTDVRRWHDAGLDWRAVRERIVEAYAGDDFTDVRPNTGFAVLGLLAGRDFSERILITNNCGFDTDSTSASVGAFLAILDPDSIPARWLAPIGDDLVLNPEIRDITAPSTIAAFADLVVDLRERIGGAPPPIPEPDGGARPRGLSVTRAWVSTDRESWDGRDLTGLPHAGAPLPDFGVVGERVELPGTWVRMPRADFQSPIQLLTYPLDGRGTEQIRLVVNCTEHFRVWLDAEYLFGAQGSQYLFPSPHSTPLGQFVDLDLPAGAHELTIAIRRPPRDRDVAEWIVAVAETPSMLWVPFALRESTESISG